MAAGWLQQVQPSSPHSRCQCQRRPFFSGKQVLSAQQMSLRPLLARRQFVKKPIKLAWNKCTSSLGVDPFLIWSKTVEASGCCSECWLGGLPS